MFLHSLSHSLFLMWAQRVTIPRPPDYELLMRVSIDLYRFVSVCTSLSCCTTIVKDSRDLYRFGGNTGTKTGTLILAHKRHLQ